MGMKRRTVVLGSASPRRRELLRTICPSYEIRVADVDEHCLLTDPAQYAMYTAGKKAAAIAIREDEMLVCADTIVYFGGRFLGKPRDEAEATAMLTAMNGRINTVYTGVCIKSAQGMEFFVAASDVRIDMTEAAIADYVAGGNAMDKAGAYGIQDDNFHAVLVNGTMSNVVGLPIEALAKHLAKYDIV